MTGLAAALVFVVALAVGTGSWLVMVGVPAGLLQLGCALLAVVALAVIRLAGSVWVSDKEAGNE